MHYLALKHLHMSCAGLSLALFVYRGLLMLRASPRLQQKWLRILPHVVDTTLLGSAIALTVTIGQYPFVNGWLTAKLGALLLYIVLGTIALKRGKTMATRRSAFIAALAVFAYIVSVAISKQALPIT
ncbi:SirB2 family protein [Massilia sp. TS11]|uniref:SirB2 family protein n=1 Tax=Massilia sp. TS11 TaxID=2908003 RepID=UPI001EDAF726|nr:SirB2 family protein [Massilia sp. TS11]MCG2585930.1 SirB2 family protein [Massilia sp. TS11]